MTANLLKVEAAPLDGTSRDILRKLVNAGFNKAQVAYVLEPGELGLSDFAHLLSQGSVQISRGQTFGHMSVLRSYATPKFGPDVGKIGFTLNFDLE